MQNEIRLDTINVNSASAPVTNNIVHFAYGVPNHFPSAYVGPISSGFALKSGLAADKQVESVVNRSGVQNSKGQIESFATIDRIEAERNQGSEDAFFVAAALASQHQFVNNYERTPALSGGAFSPFKALAHYMGGSGGNLYVPIDKIGLNVQPLDIPSVKNLLESNPGPGSYNFFEQSFGYQTYKDSWVTGAYLGGILLQADGVININPDNTYSYNYMIRSSAPDYYDADAKPPGKRPVVAEWSTKVLSYFKGKNYYIELLNGQTFSGEGKISPSGNQFRANAAYSEINSSDNLSASSASSTSYDDYIPTQFAGQILSGQYGNDTYVVYHDNTQIYEAQNEGHDTVISNVNFFLPENVEGLFLTGYANYGRGNEGDNILYGSQGDDYLYGEGGHDLIVGDLGSDRLYGGFGDDSLYGGRGNDLIDGGPGNDTAIMNFEFTDSYVDSSGYTSRFYGPHGMIDIKNVENIEFTGRNINQNDGNISVDDVFYFARYHDVYRSSFDADDHFNMGGWREGRNPNAFFDTNGYLSAYTDVASSGMNPLEHYLLYGWSEGRDPSANFDTKGYLSAYTDVAAAGMNPLLHFLQYGSAEGRSAISGDGRFAVAIAPGVYG